MNAVSGARAENSGGVVDVFVGKQVDLLLAGNAFGTSGVRLLHGSLRRCGFNRRVGAVLPAAPEFRKESFGLHNFPFLTRGRA